MQKFHVKMVGDVKYKTGVPDIKNEKVPGFTVVVEANCNQFPDLGEFINSLDGNVKRVSLKSEDGNLKVNFDAAVGKASIDQRVEFAGDPAIRFIAIPINISRRHLDENNGIISLLDIFGQGTVTVELSSKQLGLGLKVNEKADKGAQSDDEEKAKETPAPAADQPARAAAGRRPRGFDKSLN